LVLSGATTARGDVDLTPIASFYTVDSAKLPNLTFRGAEKPITYTQPSGWRVVGQSKSLLQLIPPQATMADANIAIIDPVEKFTLNADSLPAWKAQASLALPKDLEDSVMLDAALNELKICNHDTLTMTLSYKVSLQKFTTRMVFLVRGEKVWRWQFTALEKDFERLWKPFRESLYSVENL